MGLPIEAWMRPDAPPLAALDTSGVTWTTVELLDRPSVTARLSALRPGTIFHLAGAAHVGRSWQAAAATLETNVIGTHHVLEGARLLGLAPRILVPGSAAVYAAVNGPLTEDSAVHPDSPYGVSKMAQEQLGLAAAAEGAHVVVTRSFNHIGPRQDPAFAAASFARQIALAERGRAPSVLRAGNLAPRRDLDRRARHRPRVCCACRARPSRPRLQRVLGPRARDAGPRGRSEIDGHRAGLGRDRSRALSSSRRAAGARRLRPAHRPTRDGTPAIPLEQTLTDLLDYWRAQIVKAARCVAAASPVPRCAPLRLDLRWTRMRAAC